MNSRIYTSIFKLKNITALEDIEQWRSEHCDDPVSIVNVIKKNLNGFQMGKEIIDILGIT